MTEALAPVLATASLTVSKTGKPSCTWPPLPGVTPPTTAVPYSRICLAWKVPADPVSPWTMTLVFLPTRMDMEISPSGGGLHGPAGQGHYPPGPVGHVVGGGDRQPRLRQALL